MNRSEKQNNREERNGKGRLDFLIAWRSGCIANKHLNVGLLDDLRKRAWAKTGESKKS